MAVDDDRLGYSASYSFKMSAKQLASFTPDELRMIFPNGILGSPAAGGLEKAEVSRKRRSFRVVRGGRA